MKEFMSNSFADSIAQAIEEMKAEQGESFSLESINLAELERRTSVPRGKLRRLKRNGFQNLPRKMKGSKHKVTKLIGYAGLIDSLLRQGTKNSSVVLNRLQQAGYEGGATIVKEYIAGHKATPASQAPAGRAAGQPRSPLHDRSKRSISDGLGLHKGSESRLCRVFR